MDHTCHTSLSFLNLPILCSEVSSGVCRTGAAGRQRGVLGPISGIEMGLAHPTILLPGCRGFTCAIRYTSPVRPTERLPPIPSRSGSSKIFAEGKGVADLPVLILAIVILLLIGLLLSVRIVEQYQRGVHFRLGRVIGVKEPGLNTIIPFIDSLRKVSLRIMTMPIQSQGIITKDNVSVGVSAVAYFRVVDPEKAVIAIEDVSSAVNQIAQTTLRKVVGQHQLDEILSETERINALIPGILDPVTRDWGVTVSLVELKDIQLPDAMQRSISRQAEAEREKRAKIIAAEGELLAVDSLSKAATIMQNHPITLQLRTLQTLTEIAVDKNSTVVFPAPLMTTIQELGAFLAKETATVSGLQQQPRNQDALSGQENSEVDEGGVE